MVAFTASRYAKSLPKLKFKFPKSCAYILLGLTSFAAAAAQAVRIEYAQSPGLMDSLPFIDLSTPLKAHQSIQVTPEETERARYFNNSMRAPLYNDANPMTSGTPHRISRFQYNSLYQVFPTKEADLVAIGKIISETPFLSKDGSSVYTVFSFLPASSIDSFVKGTNPSPLAPLTLMRQGGVVLFPSGKKRLEGISGQGMPLRGHTYLLFLKDSPAYSSYEIINGYSLDTSPPTALDEKDDTVHAANTVDLLNEVKQTLSH